MYKEPGRDPSYKIMEDGVVGKAQDWVQQNIAKYALLPPLTGDNFVHITADVSSMAGKIIRGNNITRWKIMPYRVDLPTTVYRKKWWLRHVLPNGQEFNGWICTNHTGKENIPERITGSFWTSSLKDEEGMHGQFTLDDPSISELNPEWNFVNGRVQERSGLVFKDVQSWEKFEDRIENCLDLEYTYVEILRNPDVDMALEQAFREFEKELSED
jgi:hypothetical protein